MCCGCHGSVVLVVMFVNVCNVIVNGQAWRYTLCYEYNWFELIKYVLCLTEHTVIHPLRISSTGVTECFVAWSIYKACEYGQWLTWLILCHCWLYVSRLTRVLPMLLISLLQRLAFFKEDTYLKTTSIKVFHVIVKVTRNWKQWCHLKHYLAQQMKWNVILIHNFFWEKSYECLKILYFTEKASIGK